VCVRVRLRVRSRKYVTFNSKCTKLRLVGLLRPSARLKKRNIKENKDGKKVKGKKKMTQMNSPRKRHGFVA